jgi:hypothetical protein
VDQSEYESEIKRLVKEAMSEFLSWTDREFVALKNEAIAEISRETARRLYGPAA